MSSYELDNIIVKHYAGSLAYGTNLPTSDVDIRGVFCASPSEIRTPFNPVREVTLEHEEDGKLYELSNFMKLYTDCNPNIIETLWVDEGDIIESSDVYNHLRKHNHDLLSSKVAFTFSGYAVSQLKRIKGHNKWINNPQPIDPPKHCNYLKLVQNFTEEKIMPRDFNISHLVNKNVVHYGGNIFGVVVNSGVKAIAEEDFNISSKQNETSSNEQPLYIIKYLPDEYKLDKEKHFNYWNWKNNRNEKRSELEGEFGYDCYLDSQTEFLTLNGFKRYDNVTDNDLIGTVNPITKEIEFQKFSDRVKKPYTGDIYFGETQDSAFAVTGNHRMFVSNCHRSKKNNFSTKYEESVSNWHYQSMESLVNEGRSNFHILSSVNNFKEDCISIDTIDRLRILGAYLSDGCLLKDSKGGLKGVSISQLEGNRLCKHIEDITQWKVHKYAHTRKNRQENTYNIYDKELAHWLQKYCGEYSKNKKLPYFIYNFSKQQASFLLEVLIAGDGTHRKLSDIYYTSSKELSDGVQYLALLAGKVTKQWSYIGKHACDQIYISNKGGVEHLNVKNHIKVQHVSDDNIVCFTVPNENLITRCKGKIAIQGNTKHAMHLVRLLRMGEEVLSGRGVIVRRPDATELLNIRNGSWDYNTLVEYAEQKDNYIRGELYKNTSLPKKPNLKLATSLLIECQDMIWNK